MFCVEIPVYRKSLETILNHILTQVRPSHCRYVVLWDHGTPCLKIIFLRYTYTKSSVVSINFTSIRIMYLVSFFIITSIIS